LKVVIRLLLRKVYDNKTRMEGLISSNYKNWVIVRPGVLTDKPATSHYRAYSKLGKDLKINSIARADVACFLVKQAEAPTETGKYVVLMGE
jgi:hypothetical protein